MNKIKLFKTESEYNTAKDEFTYPTVAWIENASDIKGRYMQKPPHDYSKDYLTFKALEDGTFTLTIPSQVDTNYLTSVSYSTDNGETWTTTTVDNTAQTITTPTINVGDKVVWKGIGKTLAIDSSDNYFSCFSSTGNFDAYGNMMSLFYGDDFANQTTFPSGNTCKFVKLFFNATTLINAANIALPATTLASYCYGYMFENCTALTTAPELPATTLANYCYNAMFSGCTSLTTAPSILPATTLASYCYGYMFENCTALTTAPVLPATTLANYCYNAMFSGCTALTTAPVLPATTLASYCYGYMFENCTALTTAPVLPATTLAYYCYINMFSGCTSLTTAPELPAITLKAYCYNYIFQNCSSLNYIKAMFTTTPSTTYTQNWVDGVAATGTFIKNSAAQWDVTGVDGIPTGWTVQTAAS